MQENKLNLSIKGFITAFSNKDGKVLEEHNAINNSDAVEILTRSLTNVDFNKQIDIINASGAFGSVDKSINTAVYDPTLEQIEFSTTFEEADFDGTITELKLKSSGLNMYLANKSSISIIKDSQSRLQVNWVIKINITVTP